tara:strand:- start:840 stop:2033 length:1194 start_codon:yes stop_codon:yes gene_type:complete
MSKNTHLEHLEDDIFNDGYKGAMNGINFLNSLKDMLTTGKGGADTKVTVKWDGAPAIICGTDPESGVFFVGTKSVFNKNNPKICYCHEDIDAFYDGELASKLKKSYDHLSQLDIKGVIQGDLLYTETPPVVTMGGKICYKFKPNTITYCVEKNTEMGKKVGHSELGIVFHTRYTGTSIGSMVAGFGVDVSDMQNNKLVAVFSAQFTNVNGAANLTPLELTRIKNDIRMAKTNLLRSKNFLNAIAGGTKPFSWTAMFKKYINKLVREDAIPDSATKMAKGFQDYVQIEYDKEIAKKKTEKAQKQWKAQRDESLKYLNSNKSIIYSALTGFKLLMKAKNSIINKLKKIEGVGTFLEDEDGYRVTSPEGFVAIKDGSAVKLVDRLEFSRANFTVAKDWSK